VNDAEHWRNEATGGKKAVGARIRSISTAWSRSSRRSSGQMARNVREAVAQYGRTDGGNVQTLTAIPAPTNSGCRVGMSKANAERRLQGAR
jgi:hypothetical protein